jgi:hypothetical protein
MMKELAEDIMQDVTDGLRKIRALSPSPWRPTAQAGGTAGLPPPEDESVDLTGSLTIELEFVSGYQAGTHS